MSRAKTTWIAIATILVVILGVYVIKTDIAIAPSDGVSHETRTGIAGTVTIGPTCPVVHYPPDGTCEDRPYQADFKITRKGSLLPLSRTVSSGKDGTFNIDVPPGEYTIMPVLKAAMPHASPQEVTVVAGTTTQVHIMFDSGIR
jgi:hypothetical protein